MNEIEFRSDNFTIGEFAELLLVSAHSDELAQFSETITGLDEGTACQLRVAVDTISAQAQDADTGHYLVSEELQMSVLNFLDQQKEGTSSCDLTNKQLSETLESVQPSNLDLKVDAFKP